MTAAPAILPMFPELLEQALARQPAAVRASWAWQTKAVQDAVHRLTTEPPQNALVDDAALRLLITSVRVVPVLAEFYVEFRDQAIAEMSVGVEEACGALAGDDAAGALHWSWQQLRAALEATRAPTPEEAREMAQLRDEDARSMLASDAGSFFRAQTLICACVEAAKTEASRGIVHELGWLAFDETCRAQDAMAADGFSFPGAREGETSAARILDAVQGVRSVLSVADMKHLHAARVRNLR